MVTASVSLRPRQPPPSPPLSPIVPNQFDRGESEVCITALRVRAGQTLRCVVCDDKRMADTSCSSADKASLVRSQVLAAGVADLAPADPLLVALGKQNTALCLVDSEDFELAVPHCLFSEAVLEAETVLELAESQRLPCTIGRVVGTGTAEAAVAAAVSGLSKGDLSDAALLGATLSLSLRDHGLPTAAQWLVSADS
jgi:hypothetical protein